MMQRSCILAILLILLSLALAHAACERARELYERATAPGVERPEQIRLLERLVQECDSFAASFALGRAYAAQDNLLRSLAALRKAAAVATNNEEKAWAWHTMARLHTAHDPLAALLSYKTSLRLVHQPAVEGEMLTLERTMQHDLVSAQQIVSTLQKGLETRSLGVVPAIDVRVHFAFDSAALTTQGERQAYEIGQALATPGLQGQRFRLIGHTDSRGDDAYNKRLSSARALAVQQYVLKRVGLLPERVLVEGRGKRELLYRATTEEAHALNRQVEVRVE
jgi:outer membrane protein OmpA-like peptidoglycan-associated protein